MKTAQPRPKPERERDDPEQSERFLATAKEVEASNNPEDFERAFAKIVIRKRPKK